MSRIFSILLMLAVFASASAQTMKEYVRTLTDKQCYLAGELLCVRVDALLDVPASGASDAEGTVIPSPSRVAYVELSDAQQMVAQTMVDLTDGQGWAEIPLPARMHSGCYQLTAYTRNMRNYGTESFARSVIGVINGEQLSRRDNVRFVSDSLLVADGVMKESEAEQQNRMVAQLGSVAPLGEVTLQLPAASTLGCAITMEQNGLTSNVPYLKLPASDNALASSQSKQTFAPELEGHIVSARLALDGKPNLLNARLALVGKSASLYDGQLQSDGSYLFYTSGVYGNLPTLMSAYDYDGLAVPMQLQSPYVQSLPMSLPELRVSCTEQQLNDRASAARRQAAVKDWLHSDTLKHSTGFMSATPRYFYDLDEYTHMNDIHELIVEFVRGVKRQKEEGVNMLFTFDPETRSYSRWPALVLLDGMPVYDIDEILGYDAHLVKYVQIYTGRFTFGKTCCQGVISFVTRGGRLSNYKLDAGSRLVSYAFPQDHPVFVPHTTACPPSGCPHSTLLWEPAARGQSYSFRAPAAPGRYQIVVQGFQPNGTPFCQRSELEVKVKE